MLALLDKAFVINFHYSKLTIYVLNTKRYLSKFTFHKLLLFIKNRQIKYIIQISLLLK